MMLRAFHFLAAHDDTGKLIGGIIFVAIWLLSTIASSIKKKNEEARRRQILMQPKPEPPSVSTVGASVEDQLRLRRAAAERHREQVRQQVERARQMASRKPAPPRPAPAARRPAPA